MQPHEIYGIVMQKDTVALRNFLAKDELYDWVFQSPLVKKQHRSKSLDLLLEEQGKLEQPLARHRAH